MNIISARAVLDAGALSLTVDPMLLHINGEAREMPPDLTLISLVEHLGLKSDRLAIELNRDIVPRARWAETQLQDGDRLEIVHFVGGESAWFHSPIHP